MLSCSRLAPQVQEPVAQAGFLGVVLIAEHHQRQFVRRAQNLEIADEHLDLAGGDLGVDQRAVAFLYLSVDADAPFAAHLLDLGKDRRIRVAQHLRHAVMIAQVDEQNPAMVAHAVHPAGQPDGVAHVGFTKIGAGMAAEGVHRGGPFWRWISLAHTANMGREVKGACRADAAICVRTLDLSHDPPDMRGVDGLCRVSRSAWANTAQGPRPDEITGFPLHARGADAMCGARAIRPDVSTARNPVVAGRPMDGRSLRLTTVLARASTKEYYGLRYAGPRAPPCGETRRTGLYQTDPDPDPGDPARDERA